jgi:hypothetical protein
VYPQPRLGTRYEKSLKRRFEKADQVFSEIYLRKARLDKKGLRAYTAVELRQDLYAAAFGHGLCAEALMAYFQVLHGPTACVESQHLDARRDKQTSRIFLGKPRWV